MIFFAATSVTWKSRCGRYELAAQPSRTVVVSVLGSSKFMFAARAKNLNEAVRFCMARERRMEAA